MKKVIIIPARYGSTRLPGKPLALLWGKPLIQHVYERAVSSGIEAYVATDHEEVFKTVESFGGKAVMTSPEHKCGTERIAEAVSILGLEEEDIVIIFREINPFFLLNTLLLL